MTYTLNENEIKMVAGGKIGFDYSGLKLTVVGLIVGPVLKYAIDNYAPDTVKQKVEYVVDCINYYSEKVKQLEIIKVVFYPFYSSNYETATAGLSLTFTTGNKRKS